MSLIPSLNRFSLVISIRHLLIGLVVSMSFLPANLVAETLVGWGSLAVPPGVTDVVAIAAGYGHSLVLK